MTDTPDEPPKPGKKSADGVWDQTPLGTARPMTSEAMRQVFGRHPDADWKPVIRSRRRVR